MPLGLLWEQVTGEVAENGLQQILLITLNPDFVIYEIGMITTG